MNISRLCSIHNAPDDITTHQVVSEYAAPLFEQFSGRGFGPDQEWAVEQAIVALRAMLEDGIGAGALKEKNYKAIQGFLDEASKEIPGDVPRKRAA